ncbi:MAG: hypothetical protein ACYC44_03500 [Patescibacteria group bacterium]
MQRVVHCLKQISPAMMMFEIGAAGMFASLIILAMLDLSTPYDSVSHWSLNWLIPFFVSFAITVSSLFISSHMKKRDEEDADSLFISILRPGSATLAVVMGWAFIEVYREDISIGHRLAVLSFTGILCVFCSAIFVGTVTKSVKSCCQHLKHPA